MIITVKDLDFSYNGKPVLKGVDLEVKEGEFLGILGPNGSGKTTLLKCLNRSLKVPKGKVTVQGKDVKEISRKELAR
jgi:iron complex transport system ATP-binding protein